MALLASAGATHGFARDGPRMVFLISRVPAAEVSSSLELGEEYSGAALNIDDRADSHIRLGMERQNQLRARRVWRRWWSDLLGNSSSSS